MKTFTLISLLVLSLLGLSGCNQSSEGHGGAMPAPMVSVADVLVQEITPWQEFSGRIAAKEIVEVRPRIGGVIQQVHYQEGAIVNEGELLFTIDPQPYRAELQRARAELERARAQAELARLESRRAKNLLKRKLLSQDEFDRRKAGEDQANANVQAAEATQQLAKLNLEYTEVQAPITGRTSRALKTKGNLVSSSPTPDLLTTVLSLDPVYVEFESDENSYLRYFSSGSVNEDDTQQHKVFVGLGHDTSFPHEGKLEFVDNRIDPVTGTVHMRAVLPNPDKRLTPGLFARVKLLASKPESMMMISESAILTDQDRKYVYVLGKDNLAQRKDISIGRSYNQFRIVTNGLASGDKVIVHGLQKIFFPNMPVQPQQIAMGDPPASAAPPPQGADGGADTAH